MALVGAQFVNAVSPNPVGSLQAFAGASAPTGWLLCDGTSYSTSVYPELFSVLGYTYGGSGANFNVPDLRGRVPMGAGTGAQNGGTGTGAISGGTALTARTRGAFGGDERLATHNHSISDPGHTHQVGSNSGPDNLSGPHTGNYDPNTFGIAFYYTSTSSTTGITVQNNAGGGSGGNMPPFLVTNYIIKAVPDAPRSGLAYGSTPPIVTALPANPQFGDVVTYIADATNGVAWNLQYDASGTYPWKFIGGAPLTADTTVGVTGFTSTTMSLLASNNLSLTLGLPGEYWTTTTLLGLQNTSGAWWMASINGPGSAAVDQYAARVTAPTTNVYLNASQSAKRTFTSSGTVDLRHRVTGGIAEFYERGFSLTPIRVKAA